MSDFEEYGHVKQRCELRGHLGQIILYQSQMEQKRVTKDRDDAVDLGKPIEKILN